MSVTKNEIFYKKYKNSELIFNSEVVKALSFYKEHTFLKVGDNLIPAILYSTSMARAKFFVHVKKEILDNTFRKNKMTCFFQMAFVDGDSKKLINLKVSSKVSNTLEYENKNISIVNIEFMTQPSAFFIERIGMVLDANASLYGKKKQAVIMIDGINVKTLKIDNRRVNFKIQDKQDELFAGILLSLSFNAIKILSKNVGLVISDKDICIDIEVSGETIKLEGVVTSTKMNELNNNLLEIIIFLKEDTLPIAYKIMINNYVKL